MMLLERKIVPNRVGSFGTSRLWTRSLKPPTGSGQAPSSATLGCACAYDAALEHFATRSSASTLNKRTTCPLPVTLTRLSPGGTNAIEYGDTFADSLPAVISSDGPSRSGTNTVYSSGWLVRANSTPDSTCV